MTKKEMVTVPAFFKFKSPATRPVLMSIVSVALIACGYAIILSL